VRTPKLTTLEILQPAHELAEGHSPIPKHGSLDEAESMLNIFVSIATILGGLAALIVIIEKMMVWLNRASRLSRRKNAQPAGVSECKPSAPDRP